ncbi:peptidase G2 [Staphylococcus epidermidis]|nr:peptidase G2 [Staphylococcus epidermidis]MCG2360208.1 peptidase G2 [Staphylococcus epidermidis]MCG2367206.1 peptidase G2 [Staphylococcus epidermidis]
MKLYTEFPIELGQEFRYKTVSNFKNILYSYNQLKEEFRIHQEEEPHAHKAENIDYKFSNVANYLNYQDSRIDNLVLGANGDGVQELRDSRVSLDTTTHTLLSDRLNYDFSKINQKIDDSFNKLNKKIERIVNVNDYGADPTGQKDSTEAFQKAFGNGNVHVHMTQGTYKVTGLKLPSNTILSGEGTEQTLIKLDDNAPASTIVVANKEMDGTAHNISIYDFEVDGNKDRQGKSLVASGGSLSSNVRFAGVKYGKISNIKSHDALLHGIDVTYASDVYFYQGDGVRVKESLESKYIHIDGCETYNFGDDGITTHHSRYLLLTNNYSHNPTGGGNNNGIEIDDGSQHVVLANNKTLGCFGGLEIKAHEPASASSDVFVSNHLDIGSIRSYNIRHIGHHKATDVQTKTAHSVMLNNCTSLYPQYNGVYPDATPRALVISAYRNVQVNNFTAIGDGNFMANQPAVAVQYRAENVTINGINITGFKNSMADIKINGGANRPKKVTLANINIWNSSNNRGIAGGGSVYDTKIIGGNLQGNGTGNAIEMYNNTTEIVGVNAENYTNSALIAGKTYTVVPTAVKGGFSGGSTGSGALAEISSIIASSGNSYAHSNRSTVIGSGMNSHAWGSRSGVWNSLESETQQGSHTQLVLNSRGVKSPGNYHIVGGYGTDGASTKNIKVDISTFSGNIKIAGQLTSSNSFADYAEYFESESGQAIPTGTIVTSNGRYIRKANSTDDPIGVISETAGIVLGDQTFHHKDRYLRNEFGGIIEEEQEVEYQDDLGNTYKTKRVMPIENPDYNPNEDYVNRAERPEWNIVGLMGQIYVRIDNTISNNDYIKPGNNGVGTKGSKEDKNLLGKVLEVTTPYSQDKGYGVAVVLVGGIN